MKIVVIGAGSWGTTLAQLFAENNRISLWTRLREEADEINASRENKRFLPGIAIHPNIKAIEAFSEPIDDDDIVFLVIPSSVLPSIVRQLKSVLKNQTIVCASKGFEHSSLRTMGEVIASELPNNPLVVLSGPNIAKELSLRKPTKSILASDNLFAVSSLSKVLKNDVLSFEISRDVKGVELCAALKGIIAIGVGIADGLDLGDNFTSLLMTYGLKEFVAIAEFLGIKDKTIYGIAGLGDLIATCLSKNSRNRKFGYLLGKGIKTDDALTQVGMVVEGVQMAKTIVELEDLNIQIPLFSVLTKIIFNPSENYIPDKFIRTLTHYNS